MNVSECSCGGLITDLQPTRGHQRDPTENPWRRIRSVGTELPCLAADPGSSPEKTRTILKNLRFPVPTWGGHLIAKARVFGVMNN